MKQWHLFPALILALVGLAVPASAQQDDLTIRPGAVMVRLDFVDANGYIYYPPADPLPSFTLQPAGVGEVILFGGAFWLRTVGGAQGRLVDITARFADGRTARGAFSLGSLSGQMEVEPPLGPVGGGRLTGKWKLIGPSFGLPFGPTVLEPEIQAFDRRYDTTYRRKVKLKITREGETYHLTGRARLMGALLHKETMTGDTFKKDRATGELYRLFIDATGRVRADGSVTFKGSARGSRDLYELYFFSGGSIERAHNTYPVDQAFEVTIASIGGEKCRAEWNGVLVTLYRKGTDEYDDDDEGAEEFDEDDDEWEYELFKPYYLQDDPDFSEWDD